MKRKMPMRRMLILLAGALCLGCGPLPTPTAAPTATPAPTPTITPLPTPVPTPTPDGVLLAAGWSALGAGDLAEAERIAGQVLASDENAAEAYALRGAVHYTRFENQEAIADLERAWGLGYETVELLEYLGQAYDRQRMSTCDLQVWEASRLRAGQVFTRLQEIDPTSKLAHQYLSFQDEQIDWGMDLSDVDQAALEHHAAAEAYFGQGQYELAIAEYHQAIALDPEFSLAYLYLGDAYYAQERYAEALPWFEQAVAINPRLIQGWAFLGDAYLHLHLWEHARMAYDRALLLLPDYELARQGMQSLEEAMANWERSSFCPYGFRFGYFADLQLTPLATHGTPGSERGSFQMKHPAGYYGMVLTWQPAGTDTTTETLSQMAVDMLQQWDVELVSEPQTFPYGTVPMVYQLYRYQPAEGAPANAGAHANWACQGTLFIVQMEISASQPEQVPLYLFPHLEAFRCRCEGK